MDFLTMQEEYLMEHVPTIVAAFILNNDKSNKKEHTHFLSSN